jgi:hypothetical protein
VESSNGQTSVVCREYVRAGKGWERCNSVDAMF